MHEGQGFVFICCCPVNMFTGQQQSFFNKYQEENVLVVSLKLGDEIAMHKHQTVCREIHNLERVDGGRFLRSRALGGRQKKLATLYSPRVIVNGHAVCGSSAC